MSFRIGEFVDALDLEGVWREGKVVYIDANYRYRIHFIGWGSKWDEVIEFGSKRIQAPYSKIKNWRKSLKIGDPIELQPDKYTNLWLSGVLIDINYENNKAYCRDSRNNFHWIDIHSEKLCMINTHFSEHVDTQYKEILVNLRDLPIHTAVKVGNVTKVDMMLDHAATTCFTHAKEMAIAAAREQKQHALKSKPSDILIGNKFSVLYDDDDDDDDVVEEKKDDDRKPKNAPYVLDLMAAKNPQECTPFLIAAENGNLEMVKLLLDKWGANINDTDKRNSNCIHLAVKANKINSYSLVKVLIEAGANVNAQDHRLSTPLHIAAMRDNVDVIKILLEHGAILDPYDMSKITPLRHAVYRGYDKIVKLLLEYGADPTKEDTSGSPPSEVACLLRNNDRLSRVLSLLHKGNRRYILQKMRLLYEMNIIETMKSTQQPNPVLNFTRISTVKPDHPLLVIKTAVEGLNDDMFKTLLEYLE